MPTNRSLAIWCNTRTVGQPIDLDTHFNYWRISGDEDFRRNSKNKAKDFLEIGVLTSDAHQIENINIFIPHEVDREQIRDCSDYFRDPSISQGIFNEILGSTVPAGAPRVIELSSATGVFCKIHRFIINNSVIDPSELSTRNEASGTLLTITRQSFDEICRNTRQQEPAYFRMRIFLNNVAQKTYVRRVPIPDRLFQSGSEEIEYIDFRLNEARTLPQQIEAMMAASDYKNITRIKLVAFLTAIPVQSQLSVSSSISHKLRLLEHNLWSAYVPTGIPDGMVVYHWKKVDNVRIADCSAFVKLQTRRSGRFTLTKYLSIAFLFGIIGNLAAAGIQMGIEKIWSKEPPPAVQQPKPAGDGGKSNSPVGPITNPVKGGR